MGMAAPDGAAPRLQKLTEEAITYHAKLLVAMGVPATRVRLVRTAADLKGLDGLVFPGGESLDDAVGEPRRPNMPGAGDRPEPQVAAETRAGRSATGCRSTCTC